MSAGQPWLCSCRASLRGICCGRWPARGPGSITVGGFWLTSLIIRNGAGGEALEELLALTASGRLRPLVGSKYDLGRARDAHEDLLARRTKGKLVLLT
ncbi:zinc-binding dehydrogenase [Streptomyces sp. NPDC001296]